MAIGEGFGKVILFGEHFVVYGLPGIASALGNKTIAEVEPAEKTEIIDNRPETPGYKEKKKEQQEKSMKFIWKAMGLDPEKNPVKITLSGDLLATSGTGASAASCAAIARALNVQFNLGFDDEKINQIAYEGERGYHGTPSGIDNSCATFGGLIWFKKNLDGPNTIERLSAERPIEIVEGNTGLTADTAEVVADVAKKREENPEEFKQIFSEYEKVVSEARNALEAGDVERIGQLMDKNHELLKRIGVSCDELENLIRIAKENGALGAKLTGTGRGGYMIALTPGKELQEKVAKAIENAGFMVLRTSIG